MYDEQDTRRIDRLGTRRSMLGRRKFLGIAGAAAASLAAAACGGSSSNAPTTKPGTAATQAGAGVATRAASPAVAGAATAAGTPARAGSPAAAARAVTGTIVYIDTDDDPASSAWHDKYQKAFIGAHSGVKIDGNAYGSADYATKLSTALATGTQLDMLFWDNANIPQLGAQGKLLDLRSMMDEVYPLVGGKAQFAAQSLSIYTGPNGEVWGAPYYLEPQVWWYRQDLLQEAGLTPPADHWNWDFMLKAAKALHKPPQTYGVGFSTAANNAGYNPLVSLILNNGGHFVSADLKDVAFDSAEVREAVQLIQELSQYLPPGTGTWANPQVVDGIVHGTVGMGNYYGRVFQNLSTQNKPLIGKWSNTLIPYNKQPINWGSFGAHAVLKSAKNPDGAKELIKFAFSKDQYFAYLLSTPGLYAPAVPSYGTDPAYTNDATLKLFDPKMVATVTDASKNAYSFIQEGPTWQVNPKSGSLSSSNFLPQVVQRVIVNKESVDSAVTWGAGQIKQIMAG